MTCRFQQSNSWDQGDKGTLFTCVSLLVKSLEELDITKSKIAIAMNCILTIGGINKIDKKFEEYLKKKLLVWINEKKNFAKDNI